MTDRKHKKDDRAVPKAAPAAGAPEEQPQAASGQDEPQAAATKAAPPAGDDEVARLSAERDEYLDHLRRLKAEFENYRKRVQRDNEELRLRAAEAVVESLLPVIDNIGRALQAAAQHQEGQLIEGVERVAEQLKGTLSGHGLEQLGVEPGVSFDPTLHEAVMVQKTDHFEEGQVAQVLEDGYLLHGRLLRPAKVIVAG